MRVLYLTNAAQIGGGNTNLLALWRACEPKGISPIAVCPTEGPMVAACRQIDVPCEVVEYHQPSIREPLRSWIGYRRWRRLLRAHKIDLVHANDPFGARSIGLAAHRLGLPVACYVQYPPAANFMEWVFRRLPKPDCFIFCSRALQQEVGAFVAKPCPLARQVVIHNATVVRDFEPVAAVRSDRPRVGIIANLIPVKGHLDYLSMAHELTSAGIEADYWIIGGDIHGKGYRQTLEARTRELGLEKHVSFLGHRSDVPELVRELDVVVCSSHVEPFGICLIEAMAAGKPVVATCVGGIPEVVEDGVTGILVPSRAPAELAWAVKRLLQDPELGREMGHAGRKRVEGHFTHEAQAEKVLAVYKDLVSTPALERRFCESG